MFEINLHFTVAGYILDDPIETYGRDERNFVMLRMCLKEKTSLLSTS